MKYVYLFREGDASMRDLLGSRGAGLAEMTRSGAPVPAGFTITTEACNYYSANGRQFPEGLMDQVRAALVDVEKETGKKFGDPSNPLLVSIRSGAKFSMPGMMDTVLNLGLNQETREGLAMLTDNPRFAADAYRRFVQLFGKNVLGVGGEKFKHVMDEAKGHGKRQDTDLSADELLQITDRFKAIIRQEKAVEFPHDPQEQLQEAIAAVFRSWNGRRAVDYRRLNRIPDGLGTGVNVQTMVFGNMGNDSATGVAFSRNPSTGENKLYGEYLVNAQGEDVVAGVRTPRPISEMERDMPEVYRQFEDIARSLESHYKDVQDMEFTVERSKLYMLQTRTGKRTGAAAVKIAVDFLRDRIITERDAILRVQPENIMQLFASRLRSDVDQAGVPIAFGLGASIGAATGVVVFDADRAERLHHAGKKVVFVRHEVGPEDFHGIVAADGCITSRGGLTSHAAVVCRGLGKPCVTGTGLKIDYAATSFQFSGITVSEGDFITIDGESGRVYRGALTITTPNISDDPHLAEFAALVYHARPEDYLEDGLGHFWMIRDVLSNKMLPRTFEDNDPPLRGRREVSWKPSTNNYISFVQPSTDTARYLVNLMYLTNSYETDMSQVIWGIIDNFARLLQTEVGIGNHHRVIRPLADPEVSFVDARGETFTITDNGTSQLIGIEFFSINHVLRNYLSWEYVQVWVVVDVPEAHNGGLWKLDSKNPAGESIIPCTSRLRAYVAVLNGKLLTPNETRVLYNDLRLREFGWSWYKENNTSRRHIVDDLHRICSGG